MSECTACSAGQSSQSTSAAGPTACVACEAQQYSLEGGLCVGCPTGTETVPGETGQAVCNCKPDFYFDTVKLKSLPEIAEAPSSASGTSYASQGFKDDAGNDISRPVAWHDQVRPSPYNMP